MLVMTRDRDVLRLKDKLQSYGMVRVSRCRSRDALLRLFRVLTFDRSLKQSGMEWLKFVVSRHCRAVQLLLVLHCTLE